MTHSEARPRISVCGIGASAGGIEALQQFFAGVAPNLGLAYVVIVHLAPDHKSELPANLSRCTTMPVVQVGDSRQEPLQPDHVYVIAPDRKLEITDSAVGASLSTSREASGPSSICSFVRSRRRMATGLPCSCPGAAAMVRSARAP